jgi:hypothetical protein
MKKSRTPHNILKIYYGQNILIFLIFNNTLEVHRFEWVHLVCWPLLYQPQMTDDDDDERWAVSGMCGRGDRSTEENLPSVPLCPPQIPHGMTWARTQAARVRSQRLTSWAWHGPKCIGCTESNKRNAEKVRQSWHMPALSRNDWGK